MTGATERAPEAEAAPHGIVTRTDLAIVEIKSDLKVGFAELQKDHSRLEEKIKGLDTGIRGEIKGLNTGVSVIKRVLVGVMAPLAIAVLVAVMRNF